MFPYVLAATVGAWLVGRTKPETKVEKKHCLGPRTGITYRVEDFPSAGFLVVKAPDGSRAVFTRTPGRGLVYSRGEGNPHTLQLIAVDFQRIPSQPPKDQSHEPPSPTSGS